MRKSVWLFSIVLLAASLSAEAGCSWEPRAPLPAPRCAGGASINLVNGTIVLITDAEHPRNVTNLNSNAVLGDNVFLFGGTSSTTGMGTQPVDRFNAAANAWTLGVTNYPLPIANVGTISFGGKIYCFGGDFFGAATIAARYDPVANNFFILASLPTARIRPAVVEQDGLLWVIGGYDGSGPLTSVEVFDPLLSTWSTGPALPVASITYAAGVVGDDIHVLLGDGVYRLRNGAWSKTCDGPPQSGDFAAIFVEDELHALGGCSTEHYALTIDASADTTPPVIASITPSKSVLSPPNHKMVPITIAVAATDDSDPAPSARIVSATSNEADDGLGDGDTPNDIRITGPLSLQLRAERSGKGSGRTYTITVEVSDAAGNVATGTTTVLVSKK